MKLLQSITVVAFLLTTTLSCAQWGGKKIKGNGDITTITRSTSDYDGLKAAGPMDFKLIKGKEGNISIKGDANLMEYIITEVKDNKLIVRVENGVNLDYTKAIIVTVPYESISSVSLAGSGDIVSSGIIEANQFQLSLAGSGDIDLAVQSESLESAIAGSGDISIKGKTKELITKIAGSGDFDGSDLQSTDVTAKITGSGDINVVCNGKLMVRITGSGDVNYSGKPTSKDTKIMGSGSVSN